MPRKKTTTAVPVTSIRHKDKRKNIPTEDLRGFLKDEEKQPKAILYARDPSLDPQLVWKGKDEQDKKDLVVPAVPIYIQEKIHPQVIIENVRSEASKGAAEQQLGLFSDFNGIKFEDMVDFYKHEQNWSNRMILGDSLMVMTSLAEKEGLKSKVQMVFIDPPYGIKFGSNWQVSTRKRDVKDGRAEDATRQPEQVKAFRDTWELGIHSYLAYLRDRLTVARELLTDSGSVFVQIGNENVHLVRCLMDEVLGSENFVSLIAFVKTASLSGNLLSSNYDYLVWYAKDIKQVKYRQLFIPKRERTELGTFSWIELKNGTVRRLSNEEMSGAVPLPEGRRFRAADISGQGETNSGSFEFTFEGKKYTPSSGRHWSTNFEGMQNLLKLNRIVSQGNTLAYKRFEDDFPVMPIVNAWDDTIIGTFTSKVYVVQTSQLTIERCLLMTTDPGDLVIDPTCGSGTTAFVAEQWGRRWITCDTSRVAIALARTRLMAARHPFYLLQDSVEGQRKEAELAGRMLSESFTKTEGDIRKGFVYKRVPHVTLKSIANNPDITEGMTREQIDAAISKHADTEILYDQPMEDLKRIRVAGPFTVESLSPHRVLSGEIEQSKTESAGQKDVSAVQFVTMIIDNLKKAGVQNRIKDERLKFTRLEAHAGIYIQASGEYEEKGKTKRVAVCIGPEHGTVGPELVKDAAIEATKGIGFDLLIVCGFAFDPHISEEVKDYGKLVVLPTRMNPDLAMGDELLKKTGTGNLFMVFGEPDLDVKKLKDGKYVVKLKGVDVYDPTTGQVRSNSTDDIACWFIDTDYNGQSFFVRHAYFTGAEEPFERLQRALRAEINESAWQMLYATESQAFEKPTKGKIAVKVINHYGDEVLKVYDVK